MKDTPVTDVVTLSTLLAQADALERKAKRIFHHTTPDRALHEARALAERYQTWSAASLTQLPDDLRESFARHLAPGTTQAPSLGDALSSLLATPTEQEHDPGAGLPSPANTWWRSKWAFLEGLEEQREQLFFARRRIWAGVSTLPGGMAAALATVCKQAFRLPTIDDLFIRGGCEPRWWVPPFAPDPASERANQVLGWLDGILVHAPVQEVPIVRAVCKAIQARPHLTEAQREEVNGWAVLLDQPPATPPNPLDRYDVHPTLRRVAGPLLAGGHRNQAVLSACIALNQAVQVAAQQPQLDGSSLMQRVFSADAPILRLAQESTEQRGWMLLFTGAIMALRNPRAHRHMAELTEAEALEWLLFLSALFRAVDTAAPPQP